MNRNFERILDECIDRLNSGQSLEECLKLYPGFAQELKPLLGTVSALQSRSTSIPRQAAQARGRRRLLQAIAELEQKHEELQSSWLQRLLGRSMVWAPIAAVLVLALVGYALWGMPSPTVSVPPAGRTPATTIAPVSPTAPITTMGTAVFYITDAAADMGAVSSVQITVDSLRVHSQGGAWTTVSTTTQSYDLLKLKASGTGQLLVQADLEPGTYDQFELNISKVVVVDAGGSHEAKLPSGSLNINAALEIKDGTTATANFDFIADQSLHLTGEGNYMLAPVIQLETRQDAEAKISANKEVLVSGGHTMFNARLGMDIEGNMDIGIVIAPDAVLTVDVSGKIAQVKGHALVKGTIKSVDTETGTITVTTRADQDITLSIASDSKLVVEGSVSTLAALKNKIGSKVRLQYNIESKAIASADIGATAESSTSLILRGTVTAVSIPNRTISILTESGTGVTLLVDRSVAVLVSLATKKGAQISLEYDTGTGMVIKIEILAEASPKKASAAGTLKAINPVAGTITITTEAGTDIV